MWNKKKDEEPLRTPPVPSVSAQSPIVTRKETPVSSMPPARTEPDVRGNSATIGKAVKADDVTTVLRWWRASPDSGDQHRCAEDREQDSDAASERRLIEPRQNPSTDGGADEEASRRNAYWS